MKEIVLIIILFFGIANLMFAQEIDHELENLNNKEQGYSIKYPKSWRINKDDDGVTSIEPLNQKGGIYISINNGITYPDELMNDFILESNQLPEEFRANILSGEENGITSWYISYTDSENELTCMLAYKRKGNKLWFISTETTSELWNKGWREIIIEVLISFEIK